MWKKLPNNKWNKKYMQQLLRYFKQIHSECEWYTIYNSRQQNRPSWYSAEGSGMS